MEVHGDLEVLGVAVTAGSFLDGGDLLRGNAADGSTSRINGA
jgi:hypothetical protein